MSMPRRRTFPFSSADIWITVYQGGQHKGFEENTDTLGYFVYEDIIRSLETGELQKGKLVSSAHLLCKDVKNLSPDDIIRTATIPDEDMEHFIYFSDKMADGVEGLSIVSKRYDDLIQENDTVRIFSGPLAGWVGVVKQIKNKGKKDRHLLCDLVTTSVSVFPTFVNTICR